LLDSLGLLAQPPDQAATQLRLSMLSVRKARSFLRPFESIEEAMRARQKKSPLSDDAARLLCERSLERAGDYYQWRTDPRLNWRSPQLSDEQQALGMLAAIRSATLLITTPTLIGYFGEEIANKRISAIPDCRHVKHDGTHHFHMEQAQQVGIRITEFLQQHDQSQGAHHVDS